MNGISPLLTMMSQSFLDRYAELGRSRLHHYLTYLTLATILDIRDISISDVIIQNYSGRNIDHAVQFGLSIFALYFVGIHTKPVDEPVAGVSGTVSGKGARSNIQDNSAIELMQTFLWDLFICKQYRVLGWYVIKSQLLD